MRVNFDVRPFSKSFVTFCYRQRQNEFRDCVVLLLFSSAVRSSFFSVFSLTFRSIGCFEVFLPRRRKHPPPSVKVHRLRRRKKTTREKAKLYSLPGREAINRSAAPRNQVCQIGMFASIGVIAQMKEIVWIPYRLVSKHDSLIFLAGFQRRRDRRSWGNVEGE